MQILGSPVVPVTPFCGSGFFEKVANPKKGALTIRWLLGYQGFQKGCIRLAFEPSLGLWAITADLRADAVDDLYSSRLILGERSLRWEGPQLLYVCLDPSPLGRWLPVLGTEPAPQGMGERVEHIEPGSVFPTQVIDGHLPSGLLAHIFGNVMDLSTRNWGGYIDFSFFGRGVCGLSARETEKALCALEGSASRIAAVSRSCHALVAEWRRRLLPAALRKFLYGMLAEDVKGVRDASKVAPSLMAKADLTLSMRHASDFRSCVWGAVPWSIVVKHLVSEDLKLKNVLPELKAFVRELFQGVGLPLERCCFSLVRTIDEASGQMESISPLGTLVLFI